MSNRIVPSTKRRLGYELKRAQQALRNRMDAVLRPLGLTTAQYAVLCALEREDGASNANLAKAAFVTAQTMHGILTNMERGGLIVRIDDPAHGKIVKSQLTTQGRNTLALAHKVIGEVETILIKTVGKGEADKMAEVLSRCADVLGVN
jgi:DNA-binding MarR family transcriptional regulator